MDTPRATSERVESFAPNGATIKLGRWQCACEKHPIWNTSKQPDSKGKRFLRCCRFFLWEAHEPQARAEILGSPNTPSTNRSGQKRRCQPTPETESNSESAGEDGRPGPSGKRVRFDDRPVPGPNFDRGKERAQDVPTGSENNAQGSTENPNGLASSILGQLQSAEVNLSEEVKSDIRLTINKVVRMLVGQNSALEKECEDLRSVLRALERID